MHRLIIQRIFYLIFFVSFRLWLTYYNRVIDHVLPNTILKFYYYAAQNLEYIYLDTHSLDYIYSLVYVAALGEAMAPAGPFCSAPARPPLRPTQSQLHSSSIPSARLEYAWQWHQHTRAIHPWTC
jgi:hypothetical protein